MWVLPTTNPQETGAHSKRTGEEEKKKRRCRHGVIQRERRGPTVSV